MKNTGSNSAYAKKIENMYGANENIRKKILHDSPISELMNVSTSEVLLPGKKI
jgi:hypothetical protein